MFKNALKFKKVKKHKKGKIKIKILNFEMFEPNFILGKLRFLYHTKKCEIP